MHMILKKWFAIVITICLAFPAFSFQQNSAAITGTIKDANSKSPIIEAVITLSSTAFKGQKFAVTDSTGMYRITNLPPGNYTISFEMEGYEKIVRENIPLQEGMSVGVDYEMVKERKRHRKTK
jgi:hypothetical protein